MAFLLFYSQHTMVQVGRDHKPWFMFPSRQFAFAQTSIQRLSSRSAGNRPVPHHSGVGLPVSGPGEQTTHKASHLTLRTCLRVSRQMPTEAIGAERVRRCRWLYAHTVAVIPKIAGRLTAGKSRAMADAEHIPTATSQRWNAPCAISQRVAAAHSSMRLSAR